MTYKIITIDGPSGVGKGTVATMIADELGLNYLDSGSLYRALALKLFEKNHNFEDVINNLDYLISDINIEFQYKKGLGTKIFVNNEDFSEKIRTEKVAILAANIAKDKRARDMLEEYQRKYLAEPGLVADGRDMGTKVFIEANIKFYLTASVEKRAERRLNQLKDQGISERLISPLMPDKDAIIIDTSDIDASEVFNITINKIRETLKII